MLVVSAREIIPKERNVKGFQIKWQKQTPGIRLEFATL